MTLGEVRNVSYVGLPPGRLEGRTTSTGRNPTVSHRKNYDQRKKTKGFQSENRKNY